MQTFRSGNIPGFTTKKETSEVEIRASVENGANPVVITKALLDSTAVDSGNVPTTTLRGGLALAKQDADGNAYPYDADANDGTQCPVGLLAVAQDMIREGVAADAMSRALIHGVIKESELINVDAHAKAVFARVGIRIIPEGDPFGVDGAAFLVAPKCVDSKAANYTVVPADNGKMFIATAAVNFTLPTIANGLTFEFLQTADANMVITGSTNIIAVNTVGATTLTYSTSSQKIGARARVRAIYTATSTLKWIYENLSTNTVTVA